MGISNDFDKHRYGAIGVNLKTKVIRIGNDDNSAEALLTPAEVGVLAQFIHDGILYVDNQSE